MVPDPGRRSAPCRTSGLFHRSQWGSFPGAYHGSLHDSDHGMDVSGISWFLKTIWFKALENGGMPVFQGFFAAKNFSGYFCGLFTKKYRF